LNTDGTLDTSFGSNGVQLTAVSTGSANNDTGLALAISPQDNSVVIAGDSKPPQTSGQANPQGDSFIAKYESAQPKVLNSPDFNGDGNRDLIWRNKSTGVAVAGFLNGTTQVGSQSFTDTLNDPNWQIVGTGDFDNDGKDDLLWRSSLTGTNVVWYMGGNGTTKIGQQTIKYLSGADATLGGSIWKVRGVADLNKDGFDDIIWRSSLTGTNVVWYLGGSDGTTLTDLKTVGPEFLGSWDLQAVNDFDRDGAADFFWRNTDTGAHAIWYLGGASGNNLVADQALTAETNLSWQVVGSGDFTKDGDADLLWRNTSTGATRVWELQGTSFRTNEPISPTATSTYPSLGSNDWSLI
jgi:hypothetical protein